MGVFNAKSYNCDTPPSRVPVWKMEHGSTAKINFSLLDTRNCNFKVMRTLPWLLGSQGKAKNSLIRCEINFIFVPERTVLLRLVVHS